MTCLQWLRHDLFICIYYANLCSLVTPGPPHFSLHKLSTCKYPKPRLLLFSHRHYEPYRYYLLQSSFTEKLCRCHCVSALCTIDQAPLLWGKYMTLSAWVDWQFAGGVKGHISRCPQLERAHTNSNRIILLTNWGPGLLDLPLQLQQMFHDQL